MLRRWLLWLVPLLLCFALSALFWQYLGKDPTMRNDTMLGTTLPSATMADLNSGKPITLPLLSKVPYVLNFWGSWCASCQAETPMLTQLQQQGITLVGVNYKDTPLDALKFLASYGNPFALNLQDSDGQFGLRVGVTGAPETFVLNPQGAIKIHLVGELNAQQATAISQCIAILQANPTAECS